MIVAGPGASEGGSDGSDGRLSERVAAIEAHLQHIATREDISNNSQKNLRWTVGIMIASLVAAVGATATVVATIVSR